MERQGERADLRLRDGRRRRRLLRDAEAADVRGRRGHRQARSGRTRTGSTRRSSPRRISCSSSATATSMRWSRADAIRRHRRRGLHRLAARGRARRRGPRGRRRRLLHRLLRPGGEGGRTRAGSTCGGSTSPRRRSTSTASTVSSTSPRRPACAASATCFPLYVRRNVIATQRVLEAAARRASASSSRPRRRSTARPSRIRRRRTRSRGRSRRTGSRSSPASISRARTRPASALDAVVLRYFTVYGPRQRPDMFFRRVCDALARRRRRSRSTASGEQSRSFTYVGDAVAATIAAMERAPAGAVYNVGGGDEASMLEAIALLERISGRQLDVAHIDAAKGDVAPHEGRRRAHPRRARLGAARRRSTTACRRCGRGPPVESPRDEPRAAARAGSRQFDPEAEQEIDFGRYARLLATRWWLPVGGLRPRRDHRLSRSRSAAARSARRPRRSTSASRTPRAGTSRSRRPQTNPSTVRAIAHVRRRRPKVALQCHTMPVVVPRRDLDAADLRQPVEERPEPDRRDHRPVVEAPRRDVRGERARERGDRARLRHSRTRRSRRFRAQISNDEKAINTIQAGIASPTSRRPTSCSCSSSSATLQDDLSEHVAAAAPGDAGRGAEDADAGAARRRSPRAAAATPSSSRR